MPQVTASGMKSVDVLGVSKMGSADCGCESFRRQRLRYKMDVVCHQAVAENQKLALFALLLQKIKICVAVFIHEKYVLTIVSALCDVMRMSHRHYSCCSWHKATIPYQAALLSIVYSYLRRESRRCEYGEKRVQASHKARCQSPRFRNAHFFNPSETLLSVNVCKFVILKLGNHGNTVTGNIFGDGC